MSTPRVELIAQNIATTLATITTANGYNQDVTVTRPATANADVPKATNAVVLKYADAEVEEPPQGRVQWLQTFAASVLKRLDGDDATPIDQQLMVAAADIMKVLRVDRTRGTGGSGDPLAVDTKITGVIWDIDESTGTQSATVVFTVQYRTDEDDPFIAG